MRKTTLYLGRATNSTHADVFLKKPRATTTYKEDCGCGLGRDCYLWLDGSKPRPITTFRGSVLLDDLCRKGLRRAGIEIKEGQLLELTISGKPVSPAKPKKRK